MRTPNEKKGYTQERNPSLGYEEEISHWLIRQSWDVDVEGSLWVWQINLEGTYTFSSDAVGNILGYRPEEIVGKKFYSFFCLEDRDMLQKTAMGIIDSGLPFTRFRNRVVHRNGSVVVLETSGIPIFGLDGKAIAYYGGNRAVTCLKDKEKQFWHEESVFWEVFGKLDDAVYLEVLNREGSSVIVQANEEAFRRIAGDGNSLIGKDFLADFGLKSIEPGPEKIKERLNQGQPVHYIVSRIGPGLEDRWEEIASVPVKMSGKYAIISINRDITEQKRMKEELESTRLQLQAQYKTSPIPTTTWRHIGGDFELVAYNDAIESLTNGRISSFVGERLSEMYPDRPDLLVAMLECYNSRCQLEREITLRFVTTGDVRSLFATITFVTPDLVIARTQDLSDWKKLERKLRGTNQDLQRILDTMGEGVVVLNARGEMTKVNKKALEIFGRSEEEMLGQGYSLWTHPDYRDLMAFEQRARRDGRRSSYETLFIEENGTEFWAHIIATPIIDEYGEFQGSVGCLRDVTQEKEALAELKRLHQFNEQLINSAGVWITVMDKDDRILLWNDEAERISGYSRGDIIGNDKIWEWLYPDREYRAMIKHDQSYMSKDTSDCQRKDSVICCKSGEEKVIQWYSRPRHNDKGELDGWVIAGHDVTENRHNLQRLKDYAIQVERLSQEKNRFLSIASHELCTPLTIISGYIDLLSEDELRPGQRDQIERIQMQLDRLSHLLDDLLSVSRIDAGKQALALSQVDLVKMAREAVEPLISQAMDKGLSIELSTNDAAVNVYADTRAVVQIVTNIVNNAVNYTPSGGRIKVCVSACPKAGKIVVLDTGIGIPEEERELVFSEFHRSERARRIKANGNGLGLSIVKRLVSEMSGKVWVESNGEDQGSAFFVLLPASALIKVESGDEDATSDL